MNRQTWRSIFRNIDQTWFRGLAMQNNPLYLETFQQAGTGSEGALRFHYIVHCSLDAVEEKREYFHQVKPVHCEIAGCTWVRAEGSAYLQSCSLRKHQESRPMHTLACSTQPRILKYTGEHGNEVYQGSLPSFSIIHYLPPEAKWTLLHICAFLLFINYQQPVITNRIPLQIMACVFVQVREQHKNEVHPGAG